MKNTMSFIGKSILFLLAGVSIGTVLLVAAYMLPVNMENRDSSYETLEKEGWYPRATVSSMSLATYFHSLLPDILDGGTDRVMLYTALDDSAGNPLLRAMESYSVYSGSYTRYWHGYVSVLRPLMLIFDYIEFRIINGLGQLILMLALAFLIGREKGIRYVAMLVTSYVLLMPAALSMSLQFTWVFYISFLGTLVLLRKRSFFAEKNRYLFFFMSLGMLTSYFDLLTYPLVTWGIPLIWWMVMDSSEQREGFWVKRVVCSGLGWIVGYAFMWVMKWTLASLVLGQNVFQTAINEVFILSGTLTEKEYSLFSRFEAIYINWKHYGYKVYAMLLAVWLVWWISGCLLRGWKRDSRRYAYLLTGFSSVVWYLVLANHTQVHHFFTYRIFAVSILAFLAIVLCSSYQTKKVYAVPLRKRLIVCGVLLTAGVLSIPLTLLAREEIFTLNGDEQFRTIPMNCDDFSEVSFRPNFDEIVGFDIGLQSESDKGYCEITIWDADEIKYQETVWLEDFDGNFQHVEAHWQLNRDKSYRMVLKIKDTVELVYLWVTENGAMPLSEYGELSVNGQVVEGQLLTGITYWALPVSRKTQLFIALTWMGMLLAGGYALWPKTKEGELLYVDVVS